MIGESRARGDSLESSQTRKIRPFPVILVGRQFWQGLVDWMREVLIGRGMISEEDLSILKILEEPAEIVEYLRHSVISQEMASSCPGSTPRLDP
jgi:predicted Rossmann-fold nucleotide-binding protein